MNESQSSEWNSWREPRSLASLRAMASRTFWPWQSCQRASGLDLAMVLGERDLHVILGAMGLIGVVLGRFGKDALVIIPIF